MKNPIKNPVNCGHFWMLPSRNREDIWELLDVMKKIDESYNKHAVCREIAFEKNGKRGYSTARLYVKYYKWVSTGGDWRCLINRSKLPLHAREYTFEEN